MDKILYNGREYTFEEFVNDKTIPYAVKTAKISEYLASTESRKTYLEQQGKAKEAAELSQKMAKTIDLLKSIGMTATAIDQIRTAAQAGRGLTQPGIPAAPGPSPELSQRLYEAQRGVVNPEAVLNPARQEIQDAYQSALNEAQIASGGQAGSYQAMANLANLQRMRAALGLAPIAQDIRVQNQQLLNDLTRQRMMEQQQAYQNQLAGTEMAMDQYNRNVEAVGNLGAAGRYNLTDAINRLGDSVIGGQYLPFDERNKNFMRKAFGLNSLFNFRGRRQAPTLPPITPTSGFSTPQNPVDVDFMNRYANIRTANV